MTDITSIGPEYIEDKWSLYHRISARGFPDGSKFTASMIRQQGDDGISTDWEKYSTLLDSASRGGNDDDIISFNVGAVRSLEFSEPGLPSRLEVHHDPLDDNYSHSLIVKLMKSKTHKGIVRNKLFGLARLELKRSTFDYSSIL